MFYNPDAIISVGYRTNSVRATQFRRWCTPVIHQFIIRGYVIDKKRTRNDFFISEDYFEHLLTEIREIQLSERHFYQRLADIYATAIDYNRDAPTTRLLLQKVQNKIHYAIYGHTVAKLIANRANSEKEHTRLVTWKNASRGEVVRTDMATAKNYLNKMELDDMGHLVSTALNMAGCMTKRHIPMTMEDWTKRIDLTLEAGSNDSLTNAGKATAELIETFVEAELEKYRAIQDCLFRSGFDCFDSETLLPTDFDLDNT